MARLNAFLVFNGDCREAMEFYRTCLGGELQLNRVGDSPVATQMPPEMHDKIIFSTLTSGDIVLMASDMVGEDGYKPGNTMFLSVVCEGRQELESLFSSLSEGGVVTQAVKEEFFGTFGALTDKYGFSWMFLLLRA
jgi:PhnB protein